MTVPGAKSLRVTIDKQTFENAQNAVGCSLSFYKKPNSDLIGSFTSMPPKPLIVAGDSVYVVFSSGYSSSAWGYKLSVTAQIEEAQFDSPWILDLAQNAAIIASKCIGSFIAAKIEPKDLFKEQLGIDQGAESQLKGQSAGSLATSRRSKRSRRERKKRGKKKKSDSAEKQKSIENLPRTEAKWLSSDLLSSGIRFEGKEVDRESEYIASVLPQDESFGVEVGSDSISDRKEDEEEEDGDNDEGVGYVESIEIAQKVLPLMGKVRCPRIPTPKEVADSVDECTMHVFAVLMVHNNLSKEAVRVIADNVTEPKMMSESMVRIYKTAQKNFSQWLLQKFQVFQSIAI